MTLGSDWADVATPVAFGTRVRNALKAEPRSVKLSSLVGAGGLWYGFGKMIAEMYANYSGCQSITLISIYRLTEEQGLELETVLTQVRSCSVCGGVFLGSKNLIDLQTFRGRLTETIDQAQHFAALGPAGGTSNDVTQSFREGLDGTERECEVELFNQISHSADMSQYSY